MITTQEELRMYLHGLGDAFCGMDIEADGLHSYADKICLVQYTDGEQHSLIDPLSLDSLELLLSQVWKSQIWMHGADYDMMLMLRDYQELPELIFDTQIAARLVGAKRFSYGNLVEDYLGVELDKTHQKADWAQRPLTDDMVEYALNDVVYLKALAEKLVAQLEEKGRYDWFVESCQSAMQRVRERMQRIDEEGEEPWRIKGSGRLAPKGLAFLRELWFWRDKQAEEWDRPSFMVCGNKQLYAWIEDLLAERRVEFPKHYRGSRRKTFLDAVERVKAMKTSDYPLKPKRVKYVQDPDFDDKVAELAKKRDAVSQELDIDGSLVISRAAMESIVLERATPEELLMSWQRKLMGFE